jgi:hypothetical protein
MAGVVVICNPENKEVILINAFKMTFLKKIVVTTEGGILSDDLGIKCLDRNIVVIGNPFYLT